MKHFALILRINPSALTVDQLITLGEKWSILIKQWVKEQRFISNFRFNQAGYNIIGASEKAIQQGFVMENNLVVSGIFIISADDLNQAIEISKNCPTLDMGGNVEVREVHS